MVVEPIVIEGRVDGRGAWVPRRVRDRVAEVIWGCEDLEVVRAAANHCL